MNIYSRVIFSLFIFMNGLLWGGARRPPFPIEPFTAIVDEKVRTDLEFVIINEVQSLSLKTVQRLFKGKQSWHRISRKVIYQMNGQSVEFALDTSSAMINGESVSLGAPIQWWTGQPYIPFSFIRSKGFQKFSSTVVEWDDASRMLHIEPIPAVSSPRHYSYPQSSRIVVEIGPRVHYRVMGRQREKLMIRLFGGTAKSKEKIEVKDGLVSRIELKPKRKSSDLLIILAEEAGIPQVVLEESPRSLVVDIPPKHIDWEKIQETPLIPPDPPEIKPIAKGPNVPELKPAQTVKVSPLLAMSPIKTIVVDAGHGGKDTGAVGLHGTKEKTINLKLAKTLIKLLKKENRFKVIMTREDDRFIPLETRADIANKNNADLFISFHCNAALSRKSNGFEIYFLSEKATDDAAAAVARRENAVVELEGVTGKAKMKVQELLWSLARTETLNDSSEMAALMANQVGNRVPIINRGVRQASFYVLKGASMPAVLVESGFISHPKEEGVLRSSRFQKKLADAIYAGILDYEKRKIQSHLTKRPVEGK